MPSQTTNLKKLLILSLMIAMDVVLSPLFRIEGMAPMSSVMNVIGVMLMGPVYGTIMALVCGILRMMLLGIPPLALTGAVFGALLAGIFYKLYPSVYSAMFGEFLGTGIVGSLLSYPVMAWFTGSNHGMYWFFYTPRFIGGAVIGSFVAFIVMKKLANVPTFQRLQAMFFNERLGEEHATHS
ncbi:energy coupling factor transporter S component ThiW [Vagococcus sp. JNUCC 83]